MDNVQKHNNCINIPSQNCIPFIFCDGGTSVKHGHLVQIRNWWLVNKWRTIEHYFSRFSDTLSFHKNKQTFGHGMKITVHLFNEPFCVFFCLTDEFESTVS
jgi:hypothetical protein